MFPIAGRQNIFWHCNLHLNHNLNRQDFYLKMPKESESNVKNCTALCTFFKNLMMGVDETMD